MENKFNEIAGEPKKNTYIVFTENLVDSLCAANAVTSAMAHASNGSDANVYFVDLLNTVYLEAGSDEANYALNCHEYSQADYKKACHIFQSQLEEKYGIESTCLTSAYSGGLQYALFQMFEQEDANNVFVVCGEGMEEMARSSIEMARSGFQGQKKHVEFDLVPQEMPQNEASYKCTVETCPARQQYNRQL